jgi:thiol:disulfide interchange protein DsbD
MKNLILSLIILFSFNVYSQILDPVKWSTSVEKVSETEYKLITKAVIDPGWHLYSQNVPDGGPIPTKFTFNKGETFTLKGKTKEGKGKTVHDKIFNLKIKYFSLHTSFEQLVTVKENTKQLSGTVYFMVCDDERCLAPTEIDLNFVIKSGRPTPKKKQT